jgi:hypothetical protein
VCVALAEPLDLPPELACAVVVDLRRPGGSLRWERLTAALDGTAPGDARSGGSRAAPWLEVAAALIGAAVLIDVLGLWDRLAHEVAPGALLHAVQAVAAVGIVVAGGVAARLVLRRRVGPIGFVLLVAHPLILLRLIGVTSGANPGEALGLLLAQPTSAHVRAVGYLAAALAVLVAGAWLGFADGPRVMPWLPRAQRSRLPPAPAVTPVAYRIVHVPADAPVADLVATSLRGAGHRAAGPADDADVVLRILSNVPLPSQRSLPPPGPADVVLLAATVPAAQLEELTDGGRRQWVDVRRQSRPHLMALAHTLGTDSRLRPGVAAEAQDPLSRLVVPGGVAGLVALPLIVPVLAVAGPLSEILAGDGARLTATAGLSFALAAVLITVGAAGLVLRALSSMQLTLLVVAVLGAAAIEEKPENVLIAGAVLLGMGATFGRMFIRPWCPRLPLHRLAPPARPQGRFVGRMVAALFGLQLWLAALLSLGGW